MRFVYEAKFDQISKENSSHGLWVFSYVINRALAFYSPIFLATVGLAVK